MQLHSGVIISALAGSRASHHSNCLASHRSGARAEPEATRKVARVNRLQTGVIREILNGVEVACKSGNREAVCGKRGNPEIVIVVRNPRSKTANRK